MANRGAGTVIRIDARTRKVTDTVEVGAEPVGVAIGEGAVWVTNFGANSVTPITEDE